MKNKNMFINLDNIDVDTIERIEFKYEKGKAFAVVYHVYKHRGTFLTEISLERAEEYLEEDEDLIRSYSYEGSSVSRDMYYKLISSSEKINNEPEERIVVGKTEEEKKRISDGILRNVHKQQMKENLESDKKRKMADEILYNVHKKQAEEDKNTDEDLIIKPSNVVVSKKEEKKVSNDNRNIFMEDSEFRDMLDKAWGLKEEPKTEKTEKVQTPKDEKISKDTLNLMASNLWNSAISGSPEEMDNDDPLVKSFDAVKDALSSKEVKEEKKEVIAKEEIKLTGVVVYTAINRKNEIVNRAMMIYSDGTIKNVNEEIFTNEIAKEARKRGYSDYNKLVDDKFLVFTTVEQMVRDWDKYFGEDSKVVKNSDNSHTDEIETISVPLKTTTANAQKKQPVTKANNNVSKTNPVNGNATNTTKSKPVSSTNTNTTKNNTVPVPASVNGKNTGTTKPVNSSTNTVAPIKPSTKTKKKGVLSRIGGFFKRHIGPVVAVLAAGVLAITGINAAKKLKNRKPEQNPSSSYTQMDDNRNNTNENNNNNNNLNPINALDNLKDKNSLRYEFLKDNTKDLSKYNTEFANQYYEAVKGSRLAHSFDETISEYIAYNNLTDEELSIIFGNDKLDSKVLNKNFKNAIKEDGQLHNLQTHSVTRNELFKTQEGRNFYKKYSDLFTSMNKANVNETKVEKLEEFYDMLRKDFDFSTIPSGKDSYKLSVLEYISAVNNMDVDVKIENELTSIEKAYFDRLESSVETKFESIAKNQNARSNNIGDTNLQVSDYKSLIEDYLKSKNLYNLDNRDVSNYDSYKAHTVIRVLTNEKEDTNTNTNTNTTSNNTITVIIDDNYNYNDTYVDDNDYGETELVIGDDETELTIGDEEETELIIGEDPSTYTIVTEDGTSELTIDTENNTAEIVLDDFVNDDNEIALDDFTTNSTDETESYTIYIDGVLDENGNLPDYYKVTTDGQDAVSKDEKLPNPNSKINRNLEVMKSALDDVKNTYEASNEAPKVLKLK